MQPDNTGNDLSGIETEVRTGDPKSLRQLDKNARHMNQRQFKALCDNIARDGVLTSLPLVYSHNGEDIILSGNHRVKAALAVGLKEISWLSITNELTPQRRVALQLSHNAIVGDDDPNLLRELFESLDLFEQMYSGLTDDDIGILDDPDLRNLSIVLPKHQEMTLAFLPDDFSDCADVLDRLEKLSQKSEVFITRLAEHRDFWMRLSSFKQSRKIGNDGVGLIVMAEMALSQLEADLQKEGIDTKQALADAAALEAEKTGDAESVIDGE